MTRRRFWTVWILLFILALNVCLHEHYDHSCAVCRAMQSAPPGPAPPRVDLGAPLALVFRFVELQPALWHSVAAASDSSPRAPPA